MNLSEHIKNLKNNTSAPPAEEYMSLYYSSPPPELNNISKTEKVAIKSTSSLKQKQTYLPEQNRAAGYPDKTIEIDLITPLTIKQLDNDNGTNI